MNNRSIRHSPQLNGTKVCPRCERDLSVICFSVNYHNKDGLHTYCRDCDSEITKKTPSRIKERREAAERTTTKLKKKIDRFPF